MILNWDGRTEKEVLLQCDRNVPSSCVVEGDISIDLKKKIQNEFIDKKKKNELIQAEIKFCAETWWTR